MRTSSFNDLPKSSLGLSALIRELLDSDRLGKAGIRDVLVPQQGAAALSLGITRAMLMDTDLRGNVLILERSAEENVATGATKQKSKSKEI